MFLLWPRQLPWCGDQTLALFPPPAKGRSHHTHTPVFPPVPSSFIRFTWFYIFFSGCQVLLSALSWCFASTSVSEGVFLMYPWREMDSMSTYSSAILFSWLELFCFLTQCFMRYWWEIWPQTCTSKLFPSRIWLYFGMQSDVLKLQCVERELINTLQKLPVTLRNLPVISQALSHIPFQRKYQEWFALL